MCLNIANRCILAIVFTLIWGNSVISNYEPFIKQDGSLGCSSNFYFFGNVCTECPAGYYGDNCSSTCPSPRYGNGCAETCSCSNALCHHVYGCTITTVGEVADDSKTRIRTPLVTVSPVRVFIISSGTLVSITLLLLIGREICSLRGMSKVHDNRLTPDDTSVEYNIYENMTSLQ